MVVAFLGNGEIDYNNFSFKKRAIDILNNFNKFITLNFTRLMNKLKVAKFLL